MLDTVTRHLRWMRDLARLKASRPELGGRAIVIFLFHGLFANPREVDSKICDPQQRITQAFFAEFVEALLSCGMAIRELEDALRRPTPGVTGVITFDDGYYNNVRALDVLNQFSVPATFFISTKHVEEQRAFWWDAIYREATKRGATPGEIRRQVRSLKRLKADEIESRITGWFGTRTLRPVSDGDRPFTTAELTDFAKSRHVFLGNHTSDHAILVNYDAQGIQTQIEEAQRFLARVAGTVPKSIAYPNGDCDSRVLEGARNAGLDFGLTTQSGMNDAKSWRPMELRRLTVWSSPDAARQGSILGSIASRAGQRHRSPPSSSPAVRRA